jgi:hypothetical protein
VICTPCVPVSRLRSLLPAALPLLLALAAAPAAATAPDWNAVAAVDTVEVVTTDEDGALRETTVWLAVVDGEGYVRTSDTSWGGNLVRNPELTLRIEDDEHPLRVEFIEDDALRTRVEESFNEKYGFSDSFITFFRSDHPKIMRLVPR